MGEITRALGGGEVTEQPAVGVPQDAMVRSAALRSSAFNLAKSISIGLKSGGWRQVEQEGARRRDRIAHPGDLVGGQIIHDDDVAGRQRRDQAALDIVRKISPFIARSMTNGAVTASTRRPATNVVVFQ